MHSLFPAKCRSHNILHPAALACFATAFLYCLKQAEPFLLPPKPGLTATLDGCSSATTRTWRAASLWMGPGCPPARPPKTVPGARLRPPFSRLLGSATQTLRLVRYWEGPGQWRCQRLGAEMPWVSVRCSQHDCIWFHSAAGGCVSGCESSYGTSVGVELLLGVCRKCRADAGSQKRLSNELLCLLLAHRTTCLLLLASTTTE